MKIALVVDETALIAYTRFELPACLALSELLDEITTESKIAAASALTIAAILHEPGARGSLARLIDGVEQVAGVERIEQLDGIPFTADDALASPNTPKPRLSIWHTAAIAERYDVQVATTEPHLYIDYPTVEFLDLNAPL